MTRACRLVAVCLPLLAATTLAPAAGGTVTFSAGGKELRIEGKTVTVDLASLKGADVVRAVFRPKRPVFDGEDPGALREVTVRAGDAELKLRPPRYRSFDVTAAAADAVAKGRPLVIEAASLPGWDGRTVRLEVTCSASAPAEAPPPVTELTARHRAGQTLLTFREVEPPPPDELTALQVRALRRGLADADRRVSYRIYRAAERITPETILRAELIDEIPPLTCWNADFHGLSPEPGDAALRYVVAPGGKPVASGTGIYAHNPAGAGASWYAVVAAVDGAESFAALGPGSVVGPVEERVGPGEPILQRVQRPEKFMYRPSPTLRFYVRWEAPPRCNLPSSPYDYLVGIPAEPNWPAPACLAFHCWGANLTGGFGWWYQRPPVASLLVSTNQIPYDWWTGYHAAMGTWRPWSRGAVHSYTQRRVAAFYAWVCEHWKVDRARTVAGGNSMGGGGALTYALRHPGAVAWASGWVGVHVPAESPHFLGSFEKCYGRLAWQLPHAAGPPAFEVFDDANHLRRHPGIDAPLLCFGNGKDDGAIGWPQAVRYFRALQETRQPHVFHWDLGGHMVRATLPGRGASGSYLPIDVRTDQSLPAFTACSLDEDPGTGRELDEPKRYRTPRGRTRLDRYDGDPQGHANRWLTWRTDDAADTPAAWGMTVSLLAKAPADECTVDVTPRRLQRFRTVPGADYAWTATDAEGTIAQRGRVTADRWGLVTLPKVVVTKAGRRLRLEPSAGESNPKE